MKRRDFLKAAGLLCTGAGAVKAAEPEPLVTNHPTHPTCALFLATWESRYDYMNMLASNPKVQSVEIKPYNHHGTYEYAIIRVEYKP